MSHHKERAEKNCLNCGTEPLHDRYCHHCGQENVPPKQTLWHLVTHFFNDVTHFDGKFFSTMKLLLLKPGFLSREYIAGRRVKYLDPVRMYLFISAVFFLLAYNVVGHVDSITAKDHEAMLYMDTLRAEQLVGDGDIQFQFLSDPRFEKRMSVFNVQEDLKHGVTYYDSAQRSLPPAKRDNFSKTYYKRRLAGIYQTYDANPYNFLPNAFNLFIKSISKVFFISLPIFAFFLYMLYVRRRREWSYVSHAIFTLHFYCVSFFFLLFLLPYKLDIDENLYIGIATIVPLGLFAYLYLAMLRYYKQHWFKTFVKFILLVAANAFTIFWLLVFMFMNAISSVH